MKPLLIVPLLFAGVLAAATNGTAPKPKSARSRIARKRSPAPPPVDPTAGDNIDGDDLMIRRAAVDALGPVKGSVVVVDADTGHVLTIVNQKLALQSGFIPCSTIKLVTSVAALSEHLIDRDTIIRTGRYSSFNLTTALARSNNDYFSVLGKQLGFERVVKYAQMLGLGEKAALDVAQEQPGSIASEPPAVGGMGLMSAFGEGFSVTPLELAALVSAIANGGTLYYLQYPQTPPEAENFTPQVKRFLNLDPSLLYDIRMGMRGAVDFGTARRAADDENDDPVFGKTGTCTDFRVSSHMGWFGSFNEVGGRKLVVVVMLAGGHETSGGVAAGVAGGIYRSLSEQRYFSVSRVWQVEAPAPLAQAWQAPKDALEFLGAPSVADPDSQ